MNFQGHAPEYALGYQLEQVPSESIVSMPQLPLHG